MINVLFIIPCFIDYSFMPQRYTCLLKNKVMIYVYRKIPSGLWRDFHVSWISEFIYREGFPQFHPLFALDYWNQVLLL